MGQLKQLRGAIAELFNSKEIDCSDADWIIVHILKINRSELNIDRDLTIKQIKQIYKLAKKRFRGVPLSQILGVVNFYGLDFNVNKNVLSPRPETELLVEQILQENKAKRGLDIGTGSGAIAITLEKMGGIDMTAVDISSSALKVAKSNNKKLKTSVKFVKSDLFKKLKNCKYDFIVSNPPYIKSSDIESLDSEVKDHEPILALDGGKSGYDYYEKIIASAPKFLKDKGRIYFELGIGQSEYVKKLLEKDFNNIEIIKDYNKIDRIIKAIKK